MTLRDGGESSRFPALVTRSILRDGSNTGWADYSAESGAGGVGNTRLKAFAILEAES